MVLKILCNRVNIRQNLCYNEADFPKEEEVWRRSAMLRWNARDMTDIF